MPRRMIASGRSCLECRRRKIKCDRSLPCSYCVKTGIQCAYPPRRAERTRSRGRSPDADLRGRVERIEAALGSLGREATQIRDLLHANPLLSSRSNDNSDAREGDVGHANGSRAEKQDAVLQHLDISRIRSSPRPAVSADSRLRSYFTSDLVSDLESLHPPPVMISFIWQKYLDNVDPLIKIVHAPTVQRQIMHLVRGRDNKDIPATCLLFAVYYSTVLTMSREECFAEFEEDKLVLLKRYRTAVESALLQADLLQSLDLSVLQAFLLYLICAWRDKCGPKVRTLIGLAIGIAVKTDLHRDGDNLYLSPFEAEMRRRLWWHICILDIHTAEDGASVPCIQDSLFNTRLPTNVNDVNLDPQMSVPPVAQTGKTEMLFSLVRFEVSYFARQIVFPDQFCQDNGYKVLSPLEKCEAIDRFQRSIETRYLVHCDKRVPLDFIITTSTRLVLVRFKLTVTKPRSGQNQNQNHLAMPGNFRGICVELLQQSHDLRRCEKARHWLWLFQSYVEWEALACLLLDLCLTPSRTVADLVWTTVNKIYRYWKQRGGDTGRCRRWENIEGLYAQAVAIRDSVPPSSQLSEATGQRHEIPNVASPEHLSRIWELANAAATAGLNGPSQPVSAEDAAEMPTAGTLCEWSAGVFGQYFGLIDSGKDKST